MRTIYVIEDLLARKVLQNESARHSAAIRAKLATGRPRIKREGSQAYPSRIVAPQAQRRAEYLAETGRQEVA